MEWYFIVMLVFIYFTMGFGVYKLWERYVDDKYGFFVILFWPIILTITAIF